jgi:hypothetical protein
MQPLDVDHAERLRMPYFSIAIAGMKTTNSEPITPLGRDEINNGVEGVNPFR